MTSTIAPDPGLRFRGDVDIGEDELPGDLLAVLEAAGWSADTRRLAVRHYGVGRLAEMYLPPEPAPTGPDPIQVAIAERALDLAHSGGWSGPVPRSPATTRPIPAPAGGRIRRPPQLIAARQEQP